MGDSQFRNQGTVVGRLDGTNFKSEVGRNGIGNLTLNADGDKIQIALWGREDGSTKDFLDTLEKGTKYEARGNIDMRTDDENTYVSVQPYNTDGVARTEKEEDAVALLSGDVFDWDLKYNDNGEPEGEIQLLVFNTYNRDGDDDLTRAEVLIKELEGQIEYINENNDNNIPYKKIVSYLNKKADRHFKSTSQATQRHISGLFCLYTP